MKTLSSHPFFVVRRLPVKNLILFLAFSFAGLAAAANCDGQSRIQPVVARGSVWRYWDGPPSGVPPDWMEPQFDDGAWKTGPAPLGYGEGDEATVIGYGPDSGAKYLRSYFRLAFDVEDPAQYAAWWIDLQRDDGALVFLNGALIVQSFVTQTGSGLVPDTIYESDYLRFAADAKVLQAGRNVLAVELRQWDGTTSDASFDLGLSAAKVPDMDPEPIGGGRGYNVGRNTLASKGVNRWAAFTGTDPPSGVTVFHLDAESGSWKHHQRLLDAVEPSSSFFYDVDMTDRFLVAGSPGATWEDPLGEMGVRGAVVVYEMDAAREHWTQEQRLFPETLPNPPYPPGSAYTLAAEVAVSDFTIAASASGPEGEFTHIFENRGGVWVESYVIPDGSSWDIDLSGQFLAIADPEARVSDLLGVGEVRLYRRDSGGAWSLHSTLRAPLLQEGFFFGSRVELDGGKLLVTAEGFPTSARHYYFYEYTLFGTWRAVNSMPHTFGMRAYGSRIVSLSGDIAAVWVDSSLIDIFRWCDQQQGWMFTDRFHPVDNENGDALGANIALTGRDLVYLASFGLHSSGQMAQTIRMGDAVDILSEPPVTAVAGKPYRYEVHAEVLGQGYPRVSIRLGPPWLRALAGDGYAGLITGAPPSGGQETHSVVVEAKSAEGVVATQSFVLHVTPEAGSPEILEGPAFTRVITGRPHTWRAAATGEGALRYQWLKDGQPLPREESPVLHFASVSQAVSGLYQIEVWNSAGSVRSEPAKLEVLDVEDPSRTFLIPGDYDSLNLAMTLESSAATPSTILAQSGVHEIAPTFGPQRVDLIGLDGPETTELRFPEPQLFGWVLPEGTVLEGFAVSGADTIVLTDGVEVRHCIFENNSAGVDALLSLRGRDVLLARNRFLDNRRSVLIEIQPQGSATIVNNIFADYELEAVFENRSGVPSLIVHNSFLDSRRLVSTAANQQWGGVSFENNIIAYSRRAFPDSAAELSQQAGFRSNMVWSQDFDARILENESFRLRGNLVADPEFVDGDRGWFDLRGTSPAIDSAGDGVMVPIDLAGFPRPHGARNDLGALEYRPDRPEPPIDLSWDQLNWRVFPGLVQSHPQLEIVSPSGGAIAWEVRHAPDWAEFFPAAGSAPSSVGIRPVWEPSPESTSVVGQAVFASGEYELEVPIVLKAGSNAFEDLFFNPADGWAYAFVEGILYRVDPRSAVLDGQPIDPPGDGPMVALNPLNGKMACPIAPAEPFDPDFAILAPGSTHFGLEKSLQLAGHVQSLAWIGPDRLISLVDTFNFGNELVVKDLAVNRIVAKIAREQLSSIEEVFGMGADPAQSVSWIAHSQLGSAEPRLAMTAFTLQNGELRRLKTVEQSPETWDPKPGPILYDATRERVYWNGSVFDAHLNRVPGPDARLLAVAADMGLGFDAEGAVDLSTGEHVLRWGVRARLLALASEGPALLVHAPPDHALRIFPIKEAKRAREEWSRGVAPVFSMQAASTGQPGWAAVVFSLATTGLYQIQRSEDGADWLEMSPVEEWEAGWQVRWVPRFEESHSGSELYRIAKYHPR